MDNQRLVARFFETVPSLSPESCHQFVLNRIAPVLFPNASESKDVEPSPVQKSMCYTALLHIHSADAAYRIAVEFRLNELDLSGVAEAGRVHGRLVPMVTFQGTYEGLFVYTWPYSEGVPYVSVLTSKDFQISRQKMVTVMDLADLVTRGAKPNTIKPEIAVSELTTTIDKICYTVNNYAFRNESLRKSISDCVSKVLPQVYSIATLPITLVHQELAPFNYFIEPSTGQVQAVIGWDGARYLPVGSNFHFIDSLFGAMTPSGWKDAVHRQDIEIAFYDQALTSLAAQGFGGIKREQLESQKAIGLLLYGMERVLKFTDERSEQYLDGSLRGLSFMNGFAF